MMCVPWCGMCDVMCAFVSYVICVPWNFLYLCVRLCSNDIFCSSGNYLMKLTSSQYHLSAFKWQLNVSVYICLLVFA